MMPGDMSVIIAPKGGDVKLFNAARRRVVARAGWRESVKSGSVRSSGWNSPAY
jgi:hypothetical protein